VYESYQPQPQPEAPVQQQAPVESYQPPPPPPAQSPPSAPAYVAQGRADKQVDALSRHGMVRSDQGWVWVPQPVRSFGRHRRSTYFDDEGKPRFTPAKNVTIQLYDQDTFNFDDLLATVHTDDKGRFEIMGKESEFSYLRPYLYVTHTCPSIFPEYKNCRFTTRIDIPHKTVDSVHEVILPLGASFTKVHCD